LIFLKFFASFASFKRYSFLLVLTLYLQGEISKKII